jgi:hypothetical protein
LLRTGTVNRDPVDLEMQTLGIKPTPPEDRIHGVKLPQSIYDEYQTTAGVMTRQSLEMLVRHPNWYDMPPYARESTIRGIIKSTRETAQAIVQNNHREIIQQAVQDRMDQINGVKPKKKLTEQ